MKRVTILACLICIMFPLAAQGQNPGWGEEQKRDTSRIEVMITKARLIGKVDSSSADKVFRMAIREAEKSKDAYHAGRAYYQMGEMYYRFKNHNKSFGAFFNSKEYFIRAGSRKDIAYANFALGRQQYFRGNYKISAGHLNFAMREAKQLHLRELESDVLEYLGILYHVMPNPRYTSSHLLRRALEIKQGVDDKAGALQILKTLGDVYYGDRKFDSALYFTSASITAAQDLGLKYDALLAEIQQVPALLRLNKKNEAFAILRNNRESALDTSDLNISIRYYIQSGNYQIANEDTVAGWLHYDSALKIYKNMADAYYHANLFQKAFEYQREYTNKMSSIYSADNYTTFGELQTILKTNITEDQVRYLSAQNEIKELRLKKERSLRIMLLVSTAGFLLSAIVIFLLYRKQKRKSAIIEKQGIELQTLMKEVHQFCERYQGV